MGHLQRFLFYIGGRHDLSVVRRKLYARTADEVAEGPLADPRLRKFFPVVYVQERIVPVRVADLSGRPRLLRLHVFQAPYGNDIAVAEIHGIIAAARKKTELVLFVEILYEDGKYERPVLYGQPVLVSALHRNGIGEIPEIHVVDLPCQNSLI